MTEAMRLLALAMLAAALTAAADPQTSGAAGPADTNATPPSAATTDAAPPTDTTPPTDAASTGPAASNPSAEAILNGTAPPVDYSQSVKCLQSERLERTEPLSEQYIVFHLKGNALWLAQMRARCPGMTNQSKLMFEKTNPRICEWDTVRVVYDEGTNIRLGPRCNLPQFEPVSAEQVDMLKERIASAKKGPLKTPQ